MVAPVLKRTEGGAHCCYGVKPPWFWCWEECGFCCWLQVLWFGSWPAGWNRNLDLDQDQATISSPGLVCTAIKPDGSGDVPLAKTRRVCYQMTDGSLGALDSLLDARRC